MKSIRRLWLVPVGDNGGIVATEDGTDLLTSGFSDESDGRQTMCTRSKISSRAMLSEAMHVIAVPDLERSIAFYRDVLGFDVIDLGDPGWCLFTKDTCRIMAGECPDAIPAWELGDHSYFAYLVVDDVDEMYRRLNGRVEIVTPPHDARRGVREFALRTIDGHRIMIGQRRS